MNTGMIISMSGKGFNVKAATSLDESGRQLLERSGLDPAFAPKELLSVQLLVLNRIYPGVALRNNNGGMEFYSFQLTELLNQLREDEQKRAQEKARYELLRQMKVMRREVRAKAKETLCKEYDAAQHPQKVYCRQATVTIDSPGLNVFQHRKGVMSAKCCLFANFLDFIAFRILSGMKVCELPKDCDCIVLNHVRNFGDMCLASDQYDQVYCFFPTDISGQTMETTVLSGRDSGGHSYRNLYTDYPSLHDYVTKLKDKKDVAGEM